VIENRGSPGGILAMQALVGSAPDGHTIALATMSQTVFNSYLFAKLPYDPIQDIEPITVLASNSFCIAVRADFPAATLAELIASAKERAGKLFVATAPAGTPPHVFGHLLARATSIEATLVPYKSGPDALTGVMRGEVQVMVDSPAIIVPQVKAGTIKVLAVTGRSRDVELPNVPTVAEAGMPSLQCETWFGLVAPSRTPADIITRLNRDVADILARSDIRERLATLGFLPLSTTPEAFRKLVQDEHVRWGAVIREAGLKLN
jgi:tripartite-type tricarboxylate transporter receptor subunit TctC